MSPTRSSSPDCCARNGTTGRKALWGGASAERICRNAGPWNRIPGRANPASTASRSAPSPNSTSDLHDRQESALGWRIRRANLPERWSLESYPWSRQPGVNRKQIRAFAELDFRSARPAGKRSGVAHPQSESAGTLVLGIVSLVAPTRRQPQADPRLRRTRLRRQADERGVGPE